MIVIAMILALIEPEMSSKKASFDGQFCVFEEDVVLDHPFGRLSTAKAILEKGEEGQFSFQKAWFERYVKVVLGTGTVVECFSAQADVLSKTFQLQGDVHYKESEGLEIKAERAEASFIEKNDNFTLQDVRLQHQVSALFPLGRLISCDEAYYKPGAVFDIKGTLLERCELKDQDLNLRASGGEFDLIQEEGFLVDVEADLLLLIDGVKSNWHLRADRINFSDKTDTISSLGSTCVASEAYGLKSELDEFKIKLTPTRSIQEAILTGHIHIQGPKGEALDCPGVLKLHEGKQQVVLKAHRGSLISYKTDEFLMKAARARVFYNQDSGKFTPIKVELEEGVELHDLRLNQTIYGKAHRAHISLEQSRIHLYGCEQERVLYVDETRDFHLSASEVLIEKNDQGKTAVQGVGAVHFGFTDEERIVVEKIKKLVHE